MELYELYKKIERSTEWLKPLELKRTRKKLYGMKQAEFASLLGVKYHTYKTWEQGRYYPSSPARALLHMAINYKDIFLENRAQLLKKVGDIYL